jgi:integrase
MEKLSKYKDNTKRTYLISIVSILSLVKDKKPFIKSYKFYYDKMENKAKEIEEQPKNEKTESQKENWITMEEVKTKLNELKDKAPNQENLKINESDYKAILDYLILALYVFNSPRRNMDYINMKIVKNYNENMAKDTNYLDLAKKKFIFLNHKTSKKYPETEIDINPNLFEIINLYIKYNPLVKGKAPKEPITFLVNFKGIPIKQSNYITKTLNSIFGKKIGSSMLRHIYLSDKYGETLEEMKKTSKEMGHSLGIALNEYVKTD